MRTPFFFSHRFKFVRLAGILVSLFFDSSDANTLFAQWTQTNGPLGRSITSLAVNGSNLFAGTLSGGVFRSTNNGTSWTAVDSGLTNTDIWSLAVNGSVLFAGTLSGGVFRSTDNGTSWVSVDSGLTNSYIYSLAVSGTNLFAGSSYGRVFLSTDSGASWTTPLSRLTDSPVYSLAAFGENIFAGTGNGVFLSTDNGTSWTAIDSGLTNTVVQSLVVNGSNLFAGTTGGVFLSTNNGTSWSAMNSGLTNTNVWSLAMSGTNLFVGTAGGVFLSTNNGASWNAVNAGLTNTDVWSLVVSGTNIFAGTLSGGVFLSTNNGANWNAVNSGLTNSYVYSLASNGSDLFAGTLGGGIFHSTNNGVNWTSVDSGLTNGYVYSLVVSGTNIFAGTYGGGVFRSTNNGACWTAVDSGLTDRYVRCLAVSGLNLFAGTLSGGVFLSTNNGASWTALNSKLSSTPIECLAVSGLKLFAGTDGGGVFLSTNGGADWIALNSGLTNTRVFSLAISGTNLFAGTYGGGVFLSANNGANCTAVNSGLANNYVFSLAASGTNLFAGTYGGGVWRRPLSEMIRGTSTESWRIDITATSGNVADVGSYAAVDTTATDGFDSTFDFPKPAAPPSNYVYVFFSHPEWNSVLGPDFFTDVKRDTDLSSTTKVWTFSVTTDQLNKSLSLLLEPSSSVPAGYSVFLKDMKTDSMQDIKKNNTYVYNTGNETSRSFQLIVGGIKTELHGFSAGWNMAGFPMKANSSAKDSVVVGTSSSYLYGYLPAGGYFSADTIKRGRGYWLGTPSPLTVKVTGTTVPDQKSVPLNTGFTMISLPYLDSTFSKHRLAISKGTSTVSLDSAVSLGWVSPVFYSYQTASRSYLLVDTLAPWNGYWFAAIDSSLQLVFGSPVISSAPSLPPFAHFVVNNLKTSSTDSNWYVGLTLQTDKAADRLAGFGVKAGAKNGFDSRYDFPHPPNPPTADYAYLIFPHPEWEAVVGPNFSTDVRSYGSPIIWKMIAGVVGKATAVELKWDSTSVPAGAMVQLTDLGNGTKVNMKKAGNYRFMIDGIDSLEITSVVTAVGDPPEPVPASFSLSQNYPNPFNPTTHVRFTIADVQFVTLKIYDMLGREITTLVNERKFPGTYEVEWNAENAASGVYFYRLHAGSFTETKKLVLTK